MEEQERAPGWYPDPRDPERHRHWDGRRWSGLSSTVPFWGQEPPQREANPSGPTRSRGPIVAAVAVAVVVVVIVAGWALLRDDPSSTADSTTTTEAPTELAQPSDSSTSVAPDADPEPADEDAPSDPEAESPATTTSPDGSTAACTADAAVLLQRLREYPPLASLAAELQLGEVRCVGSWATAVVSTPSTDSALSVFERDGSDWNVLLVGSSEPCSGLGISAEAEPLLGCDFGAA